MELNIFIVCTVLILVSCMEVTVRARADEVATKLGIYIYPLPCTNKLDNSGSQFRIAWSNISSFFMTEYSFHFKRFSSNLRNMID